MLIQHKSHLKFFKQKSSRQQEGNVSLDANNTVQVHAESTL